MPLAAPIGSGLGIQNKWNLVEIVESAKVPIIVDAGVGTASDAAIAPELGCDGVLMNTAIAGARDPVLLRHATKLEMAAGRPALRGARTPRKRHATATSPGEDGIGYQTTRPPGGAYPAAAPHPPPPPGKGRPRHARRR